MEKIKGLVVGDGGVNTGFARVLHSIIENLPEDDYDIHHLAINYSGDPYETKPWHKLYPAMIGGDLYGLKRLNEMVLKVQPDFIFILNDLWALQEYLKLLSEKAMGRTVIYFPVDAEKIDVSWTHSLERLAATVAYTEFGKREILKVNPELNIQIIPHGVDTSKFYPISRSLARLPLKGLKTNHFIVLNANRNQPRKRIDLTFRIFSEFARNKPKNVILYLHMGLVDEGWSVEPMAVRYKLEDRVALTARNMSPRTGVSDERLNLIYNACEIGLNTGMGEGFGLTNAEHAATMGVQVVTDWAAQHEVFADNRGILVPTEKVPYTYTNTLTEGGIINVDKAVEALNELYENKTLREEIARNGYEYFIKPEFQWSNIALQWDSLFKKVVNDNKLALSESDEQDRRNEAGGGEVSGNSGESDRSSVYSIGDKLRV